LHCSDWIAGDVRNLSFSSVFGGMSQDGTLQQYIVVPDEWVVEAPSNLSAVEAASLITAGTTAWSAIRGSMDLRADGETGKAAGQIGDCREKQS
jgi:NADPH:quinone reductase-like Zn-dependent oxidoreductase